MSKYVQQLGLRFDPFESISGTAHFYTGGGRQALLEELWQLNHYSQDLVLVSGPLGIGKTCLAEWFVKGLGEQFVAVHVQASLFMNRAQIIEAIAASQAIPSGTFGALQSLVRDLVSSGRRLQLVVDDAHELGEDALGVVLELWRDLTLRDNLRILLLGENQLLKQLQRMLPFDSEIVPFSHYEMQALGSKDALNYVEYKLQSAGRRGAIPIDSGVMGEIYNQSGGNPGTINALVRDTLDRLELPAPRPRLEVPAVYYATGAVLFIVFLLAVFFTAPSDPDRTAAAIASQQTIDLQIPLAPPSPQSEQEPEPEPEQIVAQDAVPPVLTGAATAPATSPLVAEPVPPPPVTAKPTAIVSNAGTPAVRRPETTTAVTGAAPQRLLALPPQSYTLQVLGSRSLTKVKDFIGEQHERDKFAYFESRYQEQPWYVVVYGEFRDRPAALAAIESLPDDLRSLEPWARGLSGIQADIRKYNQ